MSFERLCSLLLSFCLHLGLLALALFWPAQAPLIEPPRGAFIPGLVTLGKSGADMQGGKQAVPEAAKGRPDKLRTIEKPAPQNPEPEIAVKRDTPETPPPKPDVRPIEKPVEKPVDKPAQAPDPEAVPIPKEAEKKPDPKPVEKPKAPDKAPEKTADRKPEKPTQPDKPTQPPKTPPKDKPKDTLDSALTDIGKNVGSATGAKTGRGGVSGGRGQDLSSALADITKNVGSAGGRDAGRGPGGEGGDGYGVLGAYQDSIISRVRPNWSWPGRTDRRNYTAVVNIQIAPDGGITNARIVTSSGDAYFDSTVLQAVAATRSLEPPPTPAYSDINISFTPEALRLQ